MRNIIRKILTIVLIAVAVISILAPQIADSPLEKVLSQHASEIFGPFSMQTIYENSTSPIPKNGGPEAQYYNSYAWGGYEFWAPSGSSFTSVNSYVNVEAVQDPSTIATCTISMMSAWIGLEGGHGGNNGLIQLGYSISPDKTVKVPLNPSDSVSANVGPNHAYLWWEYLSLNNNNNYGVPYNVGISNGNGGAVTVPTGSTLYLSISTNAGANGYFNQITFYWGDSSGYSHSDTVNLPTTVHTTWSAFMTEAPLDTATQHEDQIPKFNVNTFYNLNLASVANGQYSYYTTNAPYNVGDWVQTFLVQTFDYWTGGPNPLAQGNVGNFYGTYEPETAPGAYEDGFLTGGWLNSNYNMCGVTIYS